MSVLSTSTTITINANTGLKVLPLLDKRFAFALAFAFVLVAAFLVTLEVALEVAFCCTRSRDRRARLRWTLALPSVALAEPLALAFPLILQALNGVNLHLVHVDRLVLAGRVKGQSTLVVLLESMSQRTVAGRQVFACQPEKLSHVPWCPSLHRRALDRVRNRRPTRKFVGRDVSFPAHQLLLPAWWPCCPCRGQDAS